MFPILIDTDSVNIALIGEGDDALRRLRLLDEAGASRLDVYARDPAPDYAAAIGDRLRGARPEAGALEAARVVFIAGLEETEAERLAEAARAAGALVNTEDRRALCDFHVPAMLRRGELTLTVSTGGKSPGLARRLKRYLAEKFGPEWGGRLDELARQREMWRDEGTGIAELGRRTDALIDEKGWLS